MSVKESSFNRKFRTEMDLRGFKIDRIESHATVPGIPDDAFIHEFSLMSGWIEVKEEETIPRKVKYRPKQAMWLETHTELGGCAMTIIHIKTTSDVILIPGKYSYEAEKDLKGLLARNAPGIRIIRVLGPPLLRGMESESWDRVSSAIIAACRMAHKDKKERPCPTHKT